MHGGFMIPDQHFSGAQGQFYYPGGPTPAQYAALLAHNSAPMATPDKNLPFQLQLQQAYYNQQQQQQQ